MKHTRKLFVLLFAGFQCLAQTPAPLPSFDAASVKLATEDSMPTGGRRIQTTPNTLTTHALTLRARIIWAYGMPAQVIGPEWLNDVRLDIVAKAAATGGRQASLSDAAIAADRAHGPQNSR
ncbi:exported hypothetical protein [Candidatus Sulfopaludibacter sp. SbA3]|nr:exported hypothetical protein [Candidatus Sulfopaludibacter sp. SbA3]